MSHAGPNRRQAVAQYRKRAGAYDRRTRVLDRYRRPAVERLLLGSGDTVIDVACGTGANFALLELAQVDAVGFSIGGMQVQEPTWPSARHVARDAVARQS